MSVSKEPQSILKTTLTNDTKSVSESGSKISKKVKTTSEPPKPSLLLKQQTFSLTLENGTIEDLDCKLSSI